MNIESGYIVLPELTEDKIQANLIDNNTIVFTANNELKNKIKGTSLIHNIMGTFITLGKVTFYHCRLIDKQSRPSEDLVQYKILFAAYVLGEMHSNLFSELIVYSSSLKKWHAQELKVEYDYEENFMSVNIPKGSKNVFVQENSEFSVKMFEQFSSSHSISDNHAKFEVGLSIKFISPVNYAQLQKKIYQVKKFIEFLTKKDSSIDSFRVTQNSLSVKQSMQLHLTNLKAYENVITDLEINEFGLKDDFGKLFLEWITNSKYHNALDLLRENRENKVSPHIAFFNCCMAIESVHSDINGKEHFNEDRTEFHKKVKKIVKSKLGWVNDENVNGIPFNSDLSKGIIQYLVNASSEKKRTTFKEKVEPIKVYLEYISNVILENYYSEKEKPFDAYLNEIVKTRNNLTHNGNRYEYFKTDYLLHIVSLTIDFSMQLYILELLGMKNAYIMQAQEFAREILTHSYDYNSSVYSAFYEESLD